MNNDKIVVGLGEVLWDCLPEGMTLGGAPANFAFHAAQYGCYGVVASAIGCDTNGNKLLVKLEEYGLQHVIARTDKQTGIVDVKFDTPGCPRYDIIEDVAWDVIPFTEAMLQLAQRCDAVCFGTLAQRSKQSRATIYEFLDAMPDKSLRVYDANIRQHFFSENVITESLKRCDVLKVNDSELALFCSLFGIDGQDIETKCRILIEEYSLNMIILTCGDKGSYVITKNEESFIPSTQVDVVDTVGAGDSFTAAFIAAVLDGRSLIDAHRFAAAVSEYVCTQTGATPQWNDVLMSIK